MTLIEAIKENNEKAFFEFLFKTDLSGKRFIDEVDSIDGGGPLYWAAAFGHTHFIEPLIKAGADVNKVDNRGWTPVYIAASKGYAEIIAALKVGGADVDRPNDSGTTPVCAAAYNGCAEAIAALKAAGANLDASEINGLTPIYIAVQMKDMTVINALLEAGANANIKTPHGTPLELAKQGTTQTDKDIVSLIEAHLKRYSNSIQTLSPNAELTEEVSQENFVAEIPQCDTSHVEAKVGRDVITIAGGIRGQAEMIIGGGNNSSSTEASEHSSDNNPKEAVEIDNITILKQLKLFFMSNKYKRSESQDCELYNSALAVHKAEFIYDVEERVSKLFINDEPLEPKDSIKRITQMITSLQSLNAQNTIAHASSSTAAPINTRVEARAGRDVITITGGITSGGALRIGGGDTHNNFTAYNQFKKQTAGQYNMTGVVNNNGNMQLGNGNMQNYTLR